MCGTQILVMQCAAIFHFCAMSCLFVFQVELFLPHHASLTKLARAVECRCCCHGFSHDWVDFPPHHKGPGLTCLRWYRITIQATGCHLLYVARGSSSSVFSHASDVALAVPVLVWFGLVWAKIFQLQYYMDCMKLKFVTGIHGP